MRFKGLKIALGVENAKQEATLQRLQNLALEQEIEKHKRDSLELQLLATIDPLTGCFNRRYWFDLAFREMERALRSRTPLSIIMADLDYFKEVNDTRGHLVGDIVLQSVANVLQNMCRTEDIVARFGGEEFIMILSNCNLENALQKAESIRKAIENCNPEGLTVTSSIGAAQLEDDDKFETLFDKADKAVYEAKETGRNKVVAG